MESWSSTASSAYGVDLGVKTTPVQSNKITATQRVAGRESLVIPVATPVENALDNEPAVFSSKVTNQTGLITHDEVKERAYDEVIVIIDELHTDIKDLLVQRPQWNNTKSKETSQRLAVPIDSTSVHGTVSPFTNNDP